LVNLEKTQASLLSFAATTMHDLQDLLEKNRRWANQITQQTPDFFQKLAEQQTPEYLWIGCSDSRVPATQLMGLNPGEMFVHRNVANIVTHTDFNCLSVLQYAVEVLKVKHVIVCGHYGCGGVIAAFYDQQFGLIDNWLRHIQDVREKHEVALSRLADEAKRLERLCELHVIEQAVNVSQTTILQNAWASGQELIVHGWIYDLHDGLIRDLNITVSSRESLWPAYHQALAAYL
jgi:carbonic anhydrase